MPTHNMISPVAGVREGRQREEYAVYRIGLRREVKEEEWSGG